jgi:hypothetical protein
MGNRNDSIEVEACAAPVCSAVGEVIEYIGQEWIVPDSYWVCGDGSAMVPYGGSAAIRTSFGWLVLAKVERVMSGPNRGEIRRTIMKASDFHQQNTTTQATQPE